MELSIQKSSRFLLHFFIATNIANKPLSDCITSPKTILPFHFSPKPTAEGEAKRQQSKQLQSIKLTRKKYVALLLSDANRTFLPTSLNSSPGANCQICLLFTERYQSQNPKAFKMHPQPNKINWFSDCKRSQHYYSLSSILLDDTISFYYFAPLSSCSAQKLF